MQRTTKRSIGAALAIAALAGGCGVGTIVYDLGAGGSTSSTSSTGGTGGETSSSSSTTSSSSSTTSSSSSTTSSSSSTTSSSSSTTSSSSGSTCGKPCGSGCATKCDDGQACSVSADCTSGHCQNGICCNQACSGSCSTCTAPGHVGTCTFLPMGVDGTPTCGGKQACNGSGACANIDGSPYGATCTANSDCLGKHCGYQGVCVLATGALCNEDAECESARCLNHTCATCAANADCASKSCDTTNGFCRMPGGYTCKIDSACAGGECTYSQCGKTNGKTCAVDADCNSKVCSGGFCVACTSNAQCASGQCLLGGSGKYCSSDTGDYCSNNSDCVTSQCVPSPVVTKCQ